VHHQYCGQLGKQAELPGGGVAVSVANHAASLRWPIAVLPGMPGRRIVPAEEGGVPKQIKFKTKLHIAVEQIRRACESVCTRRRVDGCGLRQGRAAACRHDGTGRALRGRHRADHLDVAPGSSPRRMDKPMNNTGRRDEPELVSAKKWHSVYRSRLGDVTWRERLGPTSYPSRFRAWCVLASGSTN